MDSTFSLALGGGALLNQVARALKTVLEARLAPLDLTAQQAALLMTAGHGSGSPAQVAAQIGTDTAGMTRLLDRLDVKPWYGGSRTPDDRRSVVIEVTPEGRSLLPSLPPVFGQVTRQLFDGFSASELEVLTGMLRRMERNLA
jgi:DNA-binding MarR family transcriptional regulator